MEKLLEMAKEGGVSSDDVRTMYENGLTEGVAQKALNLGVPFRELRNIYYQFGPTSLNVIRALLNHANVRED